MILPARAPVKPRVTSPETGDALPLEETIESLTGERHRGAIEIVGGLGAGKTTALCHLAAVLPARNDVSFLDDADISRVAVESAVRVVVFSSRTAHPNLAEIILELTPWTDDELLEYLLAVHPSRCASVMRRVRSVSDRHLAESLPELWQIVLDKMAADDQVTSVRGALEHELAGQLTDEFADLRGADLRGCSFHLGSTRSGLVGSPYPCHGSRTGFYTDDFEDQHFKAPEEIRKANLRGADLRGANIHDVDFYLVDLRDAQYDPDQAQHLRRCGAILVGRA